MGLNVYGKKRIYILEVLEISGRGPAFLATAKRQIFITDFLLPSGYPQGYLYNQRYRTRKYFIARGYEEQGVISR